jgi:NTP pyrophosphatase (non-canonical NTP hydrolase)
MLRATYYTLRSANVARNLEWDGGNEMGALFRSTELAGEVGEVCNVVKKLERERLGMVGSRATLEALSEELGDVMICTDLLAMHYGVDLRSAVWRKFNEKSLENGFRTFIAPEFVL